MHEEKKIKGLKDKMNVSNLDQEISSEEIDRIMNNIEIVENFSFYDEMDVIDS